LFSFVDGSSLKTANVLKDRSYVTFIYEPLFFRVVDNNFYVVGAQ
jgi:hypothetical protein